MREDVSQIGGAMNRTVSLLITVLVETQKRTDTWEPYTCTRIAPHVCKVNGPCNGYPKEKP